MASILAVVKEALHVVLALRSIDNDGECVDAAGNGMIKDVRQLVVGFATSFPCLTQFIDNRR
jgi:hypothetical protein